MKNKKNKILESIGNSIKNKYNINKKLYKQRFT